MSKFSTVPTHITKKDRPLVPQGWRPRVYKCADGTFAHHWDVDSPGGGKKYGWGRCRRCERERLFRMSWPMGFIQWRQEAYERRLEEIRLKRQESRRRRHSGDK